MEEGKTILFKIIDEYLTDSVNLDNQELVFENAKLKDILDKVNHDSKYQETFLNDLDEAVIHQICASIAANLNNLTDIKVPSELDISDLEKNILLIKGILSIDDQKSYSLSAEQKTLLETFILFIQKIVNINDKLISDNENSPDNLRSFCQKIKTKINNSEILTDQDYDMVEKLISQLSGSNADKNLNQVMTYLNSYNARILNPEVNKDIVVKPKEAHIEFTPIEHEYVQPKVQDTTSATNEAPLIDSDKISLQESESVIKEEINNPVSDVIEETVPDDLDDEPGKTLLDLFGAHELGSDETPKVDLKMVEKKQSLKEVMAILGYDYDRLDDTSKQNLSTINNLDGFKESAVYLISQNLWDLTDINLVVKLLTLATKENIKLVLNILRTELQLDDNQIKIIVSNPQIFKEENSTNLSKNSIIFKDNFVDLNEIIVRSPSLLYYDNTLMLEFIEKLSALKINIKYTLEKLSGIISTNMNIIITNLKYLVLYGYNISSLASDLPSTYLLLGREDLVVVLDKVIEMGLSDYIHEVPNDISRLGEVMTKRCEYATKNNSTAWTMPSANQDDIKETIIADSTYTLTDTDIMELEANYHKLNEIELTFNTSPDGVKKQTEIKIDAKVISRLKIYRIFKILTDNNIDVDEALMYAISYNLGLKNEDYIYLKQKIENVKVGEKTL